MDSRPGASHGSLKLWLALLCFLQACGSGFSSSEHGIAMTLPGAAPFDPKLIEKLKTRWAERDHDYKPRTQHLNADGTPKFTNRLFLEGSPYLLQHAHNPMNWYPWGDAAFEEARRLGRPVLLSVGYSTCHWCHVMEEESFDDLEIAHYINGHYVAIKVDREERPDVDAIYMSAVHAMGRRGGWPMTVWLTPDRKPFFAGTYFPARDGDRGVSKGFLTLLKELHSVYLDRPEAVADSAEQISEMVQRTLEPRAGDELPQAEVLHRAARFYRSRFDSTYGGLRGAPKFPSSLPARLALRYYRRTGDRHYLEMSTLTLEKMAQGGMYDQVGGGFHRYSTDARWLVPHFEKMLYDNALLVPAYLEGYQLTGREDFARTAREILRYVEREMTSPDGGFYSATDADSPNPQGEREEGWFFTWTPKEIEAVLGEEKGRVVQTYYGVSEEGNFEGRNILYRPRSLEKVAGELGLEPSALRSILDESHRKLYQARSKRPPPLRDEKILTSWNGLMISAFASAALVLAEDAYSRTGERASDFILKNLRRDGRLLRRFKDGDARHNAYLDDYAFLIAGLLDLYEATGNSRWLREAMDLDRFLEKHYEDADGGGFFRVSDDHETLLAREKPSYDGAEPSGNSVAVMNLLRLHEFTAKDLYRKRAERAFKSFEKRLTASPAALSEMLLALDFYLDTPKEIIVVTPSSRREAEPLLAKLRETFVPNRILSVVSEGEELAAHVELVPLLQYKTAQKGKATAYVCEKRVCELPTSDPAVFAKQLSKVEPLAVPIVE